MAKIQYDYTKPARTRMAPSPTGELHLGTLRTILYNYALARRTGGKFLFRIEDTDEKRAVEGSIDRLLDGTLAFGIDWDEGPRKGGDYGPYYQLEREKAGIYKKEYDRLLSEDKVYRCFCSEERLVQMREEMKASGKAPMYDRLCRNLSQEEIDQNLKEGKPYTIRIKIPLNQKLEYVDPMRGKMSWNTSDINDYVLVKSNNVPTYHGAVVIDDYLMKITHVFRGAEYISSIPVYVLLAQFLGYEPPILIHPSVLLSPVGKGKMSKRKNGELVFARVYLDKGYPPQAVLNFLMFLGWSHPDEKVNILSLEDFCKVFSLERLQPQPSKADFAKIDWYGGQYIRMMSLDELFNNINNWISNISNEELKKSAEVWIDRIKLEPVHFNKVLALLQDRLRKYSDMFELGEFFYSLPVYDSTFDWTKTNHDELECKAVIQGLNKELSAVVENNGWTQEKWEKAIRDFSEICGWKHGDMFMLLRLCIVGSPYSPNLLDSMNLLGAEECLNRMA
ncbi:MAG: glutamate--tRNA ligase [bacterium]